MKSYNPFKMWGSWVGTIPGIIFGYNGYNAVQGCAKMALQNPGFACARAPWEPLAIFMIIVGFLIGWGIHSLFRRLK